MLPLPNISTSTTATSGASIGNSDAGDVAINYANPAQFKAPTITGTMIALVLVAIFGFFALVYVARK